jgi:phosphoribosyl 1,2-cyclic phosphate phosphodiesterase
MKITILGCGSSGGVPLITGDWGACNPNNPKNRRRRASILIQVAGKNILIDTSPDLREQLLAAGVWNIDLVLYTHDHADHIGGMDDLRQIYMKTQRSIPVYADTATLTHLKKTYSYIFTTLDTLYPAFLEGREIEGIIDFEAIQIIPFLQHHGHRSSLGFRIGDFAYSTDLIDMPEESYRMLQGLKLWIVDCLRDEPHVSHAHFDQTICMIERIQPERAILTHMTHSLDYDELRSRLPPGIEPAYDGMVLEL